MIPGRDHKDPLVFLQFAQHLDVVAEPTRGAAQWGKCPERFHWVFTWLCCLYYLALRVLLPGLPPLLLKSVRYW